LFNYPAFAAAQAGGVEPHGRLLNGQIFANALQAPTNYTTLLAPVDVTPAANGPAMDVGVVLPGVSDTFWAQGPDLDAIELGCPTVIYCVRPVGVDESNESIGCETVASAPSTASSPAHTDGQRTVRDGGYDHAGHLAWRLRR
jgi:hypothetical protein